MTDDTTDHAALVADINANDAGGPEADPHEAEARSHGWMSPEEREADPKYKGKPHRTAKEFLDVMQESGPVLRERLKKTQERLERVERASQEGIRRMEERVRAEVQAEYKAKIREATLEGNTIEVERLVDERDKAIAPQPNGSAPPEVESWVKDNAWFESDPDMRLEAIGVHNRIIRNSPAMSLTDQLGKVRDEMQKRYPKEFGVADKPKPAATQLSDGARLAPRKTGLGDKLDAVERKEADWMIKEGLYKNYDDYAAAAHREGPTKIETGKSA